MSSRSDEAMKGVRGEIKKKHHDDGGHNLEPASLRNDPNDVLWKEFLGVAGNFKQLRVYLRTYALEQMVQATSSLAGLRTIERVEQTLQDLGVTLKPKVPTKAVCAEHLELRKEILTLLNLQKRLQYKEAEGSSYRESSCAETPGTPKRSQRGVDQDRPFIPGSVSFGALSYGDLTTSAEQVVAAEQGEYDG